MGGPGLVAYKEFDNFYHVDEGFEHEGTIWYTSEALYQSLKFKDQEYAQSLSKAPVHIAWSMCQSRNYELIDDFEAKRPELMYIANYAKYSQVPRLRQVLISTGEREIEFTRSTRFWNKHNAEILMKIRNELHQ